MDSDNRNEKRIPFGIRMDKGNKGRQRLTPTEILNHFRNRRARKAAVQTPGKALTQQEMGLATGGIH